MTAARYRLLGTVLMPIAVAAGLAFSPAGPAVAGSNTVEVGAPVTLNARIEITSDTVKLGDVFNNAGKYADRPIGRAPDPGKDVTLDARWLLKVARAFNLDWRPASQFETASVIRVSQAIGTTVIRDALTAEIERRTGGMENFDLELDNNFMTLHVPTDRAATLGIEHLQVDTRTQRFTAVLAAPRDNPVLRKPISGRLHRLVEVPVPVRRIMRGETITERDIELVEMRANGLNGQSIADPSLLVGQAAKRTLRTGIPVATNSIEPPVLIKKGSLVMVRARSANMVLTARAKAMESGGLNDVVRVMNMHSKRVIEAVVSGPGQLDIELTSNLAMN